MNYKEIKKAIESNQYDSILKQIVVSDNISKEKERYFKLLEDAYTMYGDGDFHFVSSPGRTEIGGNHTDHQHGNVLAASLNIDNLCIFKKNDTQYIHYFDPVFKPVIVDTTDLKVKENEINTSESLIRGIVANLSNKGYKIQGFDALCDSRVLIGSGISSSACFEVLICEIINYLFCDEKLSDVDRAFVSQYAENTYFGKPCGLLDQMAISVGGFVSIDFKDFQNPIIANSSFSFEDYGYDLMLVNTKGDHADLSNEYAAIPSEIKLVANQLGVDYLADSSYEKLLENLKEIREKIKNDRAILRSIHFYRENLRAIEEADAIKKKDVDKLIKLIKGSGHSSFMYLQNVYPASRPESQSLALALSLVAQIIDEDGAYRVHGGGFEGTILIVVKKNKTNKIIRAMKNIFGDDCILDIKVRSFGTKVIL